MAQSAALSARRLPPSPPRSLSLMISSLVSSLLMSKKQRDLLRLQPVVQRINALEEKLQREPDSVLLEKTRAWQQELKALPGDDKKVRAFLHKILPEAFAVVKNAA